MPVRNGQALFANDQQPEVSLGPAGRCHYHEEALDVIHAGGVIHIHTWAVQKVDPAFLNKSCIVAVGV